MAYFKIIAVVMLLIFAMSCKKAIKENVLTTVAGYVIDSVKNKKLPNATVTIYGCRRTTFSISCATVVATAKTDLNGNFILSFNGDGLSIGYEARINYDENYDRSSTVTLTPGTRNNIIIAAREFNYLKTHLTITNNPFNDLVVLSANTRHVLYGQTLDTIIMNRVLPNAVNNIMYSAWDTNLGGYRTLVDTLQIGMQDTTNYSRVLPNVNTFPLH